MTDRYIIKPLEWEDFDVDAGVWLSMPFRGHSYNITDWGDGTFRVDPFAWSQYPSLEAAKKAANEHWRALLAGPHGPLEAVEQDTDCTASLIAETEQMLFRAQQSGDYASQIGFEAMLEKLRTRTVAEAVE